ncbi:transcriptional regulator [Terrisporobacter sp.]|uniref:transcriptional regulator n=1 Tax=Terrisporobacter sp. TaxID=1965305 RepID=UPI00262E04D3|nr:transcriptional regulator [Terrisporobacter sp.]
MQNGYIKLYREVINSDIFENEKLFKIFIWCLVRATHKEREQRIGRQTIILKEGQFVFGRNKAALELNIAPSTVWDYMKLLENRKTINIKSNNKYSIVTIENWSVYQFREEISDSKTNKKSTSNKQQMDTNKNVKNVKNNIYTLQCDELWQIYPNKKGKTQAYNKIPKLLEKYSFDEIKRCIERYSKEVEDKDKQYIKHGSTFFNTGYMDYLDENYNASSPEQNNKGIKYDEDGYEII